MKEREGGKPKGKRRGILLVLEVQAVVDMQGWNSLGYRLPRLLLSDHYFRMRNYHWAFFFLKIGQLHLQYVYQGERVRRGEDEYGYGWSGPCYLYLKIQVSVIALWCDQVPLPTLLLQTQSIHSTCTQAASQVKKVWEQGWGICLEVILTLSTEWYPI